MPNVALQESVGDCDRVPVGDLAVAEPKLTRRAAHVVPLRRDTLVLAAAREPQQAGRRDGGREHRIVSFGLVEYLPSVRYSSGAGNRSRRVSL